MAFGAGLENAASGPQRTLYAAFMREVGIAHRTFTRFGPILGSATGRADMAFVYLLCGAGAFALFGLYAAGLRRL